MNQSEKPAALLLVSSQCPNCHALETLLRERLEKGALGDLNVINIEQSPEFAQHYGVRSVPWLLLGSFEFDEVLIPAELDRWIAHVRDGGGQSRYIAYLLERGKLVKAVEWIQKRSVTLKAVIPILANPDAKMNIRVGVGAILEHFEDTEAIRGLVPDLIALLQDANPATRTDTCHYLSLTHSPDVIEPLKQMLDDENQDVRQVANESIELLLK